MEEPREPKEKVAKPAPVSWTVGVVVVLLGVIFLARNLGVDLFFLKIDNWWALVILAGSIFPLGNAWRQWRQDGFTNEVAGSLLSAAILITIALLFLLHLAFFTWWPLFVIYGGIFMLTTNRRN